MTEMQIKCPHCGGEVEVTEALAAPFIAAEREKSDERVQRQLRAERQAIAEKAAAEARQALEIRLSDQAAELEKRDQQLIQAQQLERDARKAQAEADQALREQDIRVARELQAAKAAIAKEAEDRARQQTAKELQAAQARIAEQQQKLQQAEEAELAARKARQEADEARRTVELQVTRRLDEQRTRVRDAAIQERDSEHRLKLAEKDQQLEGMRQQIEQLRRAGSVASQQLAGDVLEVDLTELLSDAFPGDQFERVAKGKAGGDVIQRVMTTGGQVAGTILWESKRTKTWQEPWLAKLREDQRNANADIAALASETLPGGVGAFAQRDGVWVTGLPSVAPVAAALRAGLLEASRARLALAAAATTKDAAFGYLTGNEFAARVTRIVEAYREMLDDLDKEKRLLTKQWAAREKQLGRVLSGIGGLYGDLQGIFGATLPDVEQLSLTGAGAEALGPEAEGDALDGTTARPVLEEA